MYWSRFNEETEIEGEKVNKERSVPPEEGQGSLVVGTRKRE